MISSGAILLMGSDFHGQPPSWLQLNGEMTMMNFARIRKALSVVDPYKLLLAICAVGAVCLWIPSARGATGITLIQSAGTDAGTTTSASLSFTANNTAGDFIAVCIRAGQAGEVFTV